jgi:hypothetical protein
MDHTSGGRKKSVTSQHSHLGLVLHCESTDKHQKPGNGFGSPAERNTAVNRN